VRFSYTNCKPSKGQKSGVNFLLAPFTKGVKMAGHFKTVLTFSLSSPDADVVVMLFAIDKAGRVVAYRASSDKPEALAKGFLRVSH
jgi:predicted acyl esterase